MNRLLLNVCIVLFGLSLHAQLSTNQVVTPQKDVVLKDPFSITLKSGFWAQSGSVFHASIGYAFNMSCPIVTKTDFNITHINPNTYVPKTINSTLKLVLSYDNAGNTNRIYYANASSEPSGTANISNKDSITSSISTRTASAPSTEAITKMIYVYPNPNRGKITVSWDNSVDHLIQSMVLGNVGGINIPLAIKTENGQRKATVHFNGPTGVYILKIWLTDGRQLSKTLLKQ